MPLDLDRLEQRIVGVLVEKQMAVPDTYPLTLNALVSGVNQKSNRDPHMAAEPYEVEGALRSLMDKGWVREVDLVTGRVVRYEHRAGDQLGVEAPDLAILAELLNRGPQTPGELKTRASRMRAFASPAEVEARLGALSDRPVPYVTRLARRPREHAPRWAHLLGEDARAETPSEATTSQPVEPPPEPKGSRLDDIEERLARLEERLDRLEGR